MLCHCLTFFVEIVTLFVNGVCLEKRENCVHLRLSTEINSFCLGRWRRNRRRAHTNNWNRSNGSLAVSLIEVNFHKWISFSWMNKREKRNRMRAKLFLMSRNRPQSNCVDAIYITIEWKWFNRCAATSGGTSDDCVFVACNCHSF